MAGKEITAEALEERAAALRQKCYAIQNEKDGAKVMEIGFELQAEAAGLDAMGKAYEFQEMQKHYPPGTVPYSLPTVKVELTEGQRKRVEERTGVYMEVVYLEEGTEVLHDFMPEENPEEVERLAIVHAKRGKKEEEGMAKAMQAGAAAAADVRGVGNPDLDKLLDEKLADPAFLAGILHKP